MNYLAHTSLGYEVSGPDSDGEVELEVIGIDYHVPLYLTADDLRMMLARFEPPAPADGEGGG